MAALGTGRQCKWLPVVAHVLDMDIGGYHSTSGSVLIIGRIMATKSAALLIGGWVGTSTDQCWCGYDADLVVPPWTDRSCFRQPSMT